MAEPAQKPGSSRQDYGTDPLLIAAVEARWRKLDVDLAATAANAKAPVFVTPEQDSLAIDWRPLVEGRRAWLNPSFGHIAPWAQKCGAVARELNRYLLPVLHGGRIFLLMPAAIGSNWFVEGIFGKALVLALNMRQTFEGEITAYPKDCILSVYGESPGFDVWRWPEQTPEIHAAYVARQREQSRLARERKGRAA